MSSHTILPLYAVPALPCYVLPRGTHLSHSTPLFLDTAIGSAMRSMSSHVVMPLQLVRALARSLLSRVISSLALRLPPSLYPSLPRATPPSFALPLLPPHATLPPCNSTTGLWARCLLTRYCLYMQYPLSRASSSLGLPTSLTAHLSFVVPPLALLCAVCPLTW